MARLPLLAAIIALHLSYAHVLSAKERPPESPGPATRNPTGKKDPNRSVKRVWRMRIDRVPDAPPDFILRRVARIQPPDPEPPEVVVVDDGFDPDRVTELKNPVSLPESFFERYFLGDVAKFEDWHEKMDRMFETQMRLAGKATKFSAAEERKLKLAAKGDIKHLADELEMARIRVEEASADLQTLQAVLKSYHPLQLKALSGPFGLNSLFHKTLEGIRRKHREANQQREAASRLSLWKQAVVGALSVAFLPLREPAASQAPSIQQVIDDASRILTVPRVDMNAILRAQNNERRNVQRQLIIDVQLAMPLQKPPEANSLTAIDDFERDEDDRDQEPLEAMPESFIDSYFLRSPRGSTAFAVRIELYMQTFLKRGGMLDKLTPDDLKKLRLAAQGDLKRLDDELSAARSRLERAWGNQAARMLVLASLEDLRVRARANPFQPNSLVGKTFRKLAREKYVDKADGAIKTIKTEPE